MFISLWEMQINVNKLFKLDLLIFKKPTKLEMDQIIPPLYFYCKNIWMYLSFQHRNKASYQ